MKFELYTDAVLACDVPEYRLKRGDVVKLVDHHVAPDGGEGYSIEVCNALGNTIAVTAVPESSLGRLRRKKSACAKMPDVTARLRKTFGRKVISDQAMKKILDESRGSY